MHIINYMRIHATSQLSLHSKDFSSSSEFALDYALPHQHSKSLWLRSCQDFRVFSATLMIFSFMGIPKKPMTTTSAQFVFVFRSSVGLSLNLQKCHFNLRELNYYFTVIRDAPVPSNAAPLRSFLGLKSYTTRNSSPICLLSQHR